MQLAPPMLQNAWLSLKKDGAWSPTAMLAGVLLAAIAFLVVYPLAIMAITLVADSTDGQPLGLDGSLLPVLWNTAVVVVGSSVGALVFGTLLALINERTDGGFRGVGNFMPVAPLMLPSITGVLGWVVLCDPRVGLINVMLRKLLGMDVAGGEGPFNIYTMPGLLFVMALHMVPTVYLVVAAALRNIDPSVEEASRVSGAGPLQTGLRVTLPAVRPALFEAWLLTVIGGIGIFSVPVILGTGAKIEVVSVRIWSYLTAFPSNQRAALVLASAMLLVVLSLRFVQKRLLKAGRSAVIGGRGVRSSPIRIGPLRYLTKTLVAGYVVVSLILPLMGLILVSLEPFWTANVPWERLSLANYEKILTQNPVTIRALVNSLVLASVVATVAMAVVGFLMLHAHQQGPHGRGGKKAKRRPRTEFRGIVDLVTSLPTTIPHSLVGVSFILAFSRAPLDVYGTIWILMMAMLMMEIPYAAGAARSATSVIGHELVEASRVFRATPGETMRRVLLPLVLPGLAAGWVLVFIKSVGEVTASAMLSGSSNPVVGSVLLDLWRQGNFPMMVAFALIVWAIGSALVLIMLKLNDAALAKVR